MQRNWKNAKGDEYFCNALYIVSFTPLPPLSHIFNVFSILSANLYTAIELQGGVEASRGEGNRTSILHQSRMLFFG